MEIFNIIYDVYGGRRAQTPRQSLEGHRRRVTESDLVLFTLYGTCTLRNHIQITTLLLKFNLRWIMNILIAHADLCLLGVLNNYRLHCEQLHAAHNDG